MKIGVIGAGAFGMALGEVLATKGNDVNYYDPKLNGSKLEDVIANSETLLLATPSEAVSSVLPFFPTDIPLIIATKGLLSSKIFESFNDVMAISGPGFANDIKMKKETRLTATDQRAIDLFSTDFLSFDYTNDFSGVLMCGALKNVYAILAGLLGLQKGSDAWRRFIDEVLIEMRDILSSNGAQGDTVNLACGIGDLELTCDSPSRNYEFGCNSQKNPAYKPEKTVEGMSTLKEIKQGAIFIPSSAKHLNDLIKRSEKWA